MSSHPRLPRLLVALAALALAVSAGWLVRADRLGGTCSRALPWLIGGLMVLVAGLGWALSRAASGAARAEARAPSEGGSEAAAPSPPRPGPVSTPQRMEVIGRLTARFAHEFNNQLGVISNSAHLIERRAQDPRLQLPVAALLRAVDATHLLIQRLQSLGARQPPTPQAIDLCRWLPEHRAALALVSGKSVVLEIGVAPGTLWVHADPGELELALTCVLLGIRHALAREERVTVSCLPGAPGDGTPLPCEGLAEIRVEARVRHAGAPAGETGGSTTAAWVAADACPAWGLGLVQCLCRSAGGGAWVRLEAGHRMTVSMRLAESEGGPVACVPGTPNA